MLQNEIKRRFASLPAGLQVRKGYHNQRRKFHHPFENCAGKSEKDLSWSETLPAKETQQIAYK